MSSARGRGSRTAQHRAAQFLARASQSEACSSLTPSGSPGGSSTPSGSARRSGGVDAILIHEVSGCLYPVEPTVNASKISQVITKSFKMHVDPEGVSWKFVDDSFRDIYWAEFKKAFRWEMPLTEEMVYELWCDRARLRYKDWLNLLKTKRPTVGRPTYMDQATWDRWCAYWDSFKVKARAEQMKANRFSESDGPSSGYGRHMGGSRSAVAYSHHMARD